MLCLLYYGISFLAICWETFQETYLLQADKKKEEFFPLMTFAKGRQETRSAAELWQEMQTLIAQETNSQTNNNIESLTDDELVQLIRSNAPLRRLVSLCFSKPNVATVANVSRWKALWPRLLELPPLLSQATANDITIALILPAFREDGRRMLRTLQIAMERCTNALRVQVIIVNAGQCRDMDLVHDFLQQQQCHAKSQIVSYDKGGGRGPTLDYGTNFVAPDVTLLTFLHSDTLMPHHWDKSVRNLWFGKKRRKKVQASAFLFGQDKSPEGLNGGPFPWGIRSVQLLGNARAWALSLPYGDHVLSMPLAYYRHVGGFPDQPIMEDYELMDYWRRRARVRDDGL